jgi:hypothetical protein
MDERARDREGVNAGGSAPAPGGHFSHESPAALPELLTWQEVATFLRLRNKSAVDSALAELGVGMVRLSRKTWRVRRDSLLRAVEASERRAG